jgi:hypothetical protein
MKIVWPLLYVAFAIAAISAPIYGVSKIVDGKPAAVASKAEAGTSRTTSREDFHPDPLRKPVWIAPTSKYKYTAVPSVLGVVVTREIPETKDAKESSKRAKVEKPPLSAARGTTLSFAE